jgi:hypothetical protein
MQLQSRRRKNLLYFKKGERRDLNPRMMESQSIALPLGYARLYSYNYITNNFLFIQVFNEQKNT